jgi:flap endonuclease-1
MRTTRLIADYDIKPVFVFDGKPPELKKRTLDERRGYRERARREWEEAVQRKDYSSAWSKAVTMNSLTQPMQDDAKKLLGMLGIPYVQAPQEGEAQAAYMARRESVWAANSRDYDSVLFGSPRLVRYVTISGKEFLPSKGTSRPLVPELIELDALLKELRLTREQLVDLAILVGTDFNEGVQGVGPKTALKLIRSHGTLENLPERLTALLPDNVAQVRDIFLHPDVTSEYSVNFTELKEQELMEFLTIERDFSKDRATLAVERMRQFYSRQHSTLSSWLK